LRSLRAISTGLIHYQGFNLSYRVLKSINFNNKKVLITGASAGIGYGIAKAFLKEGAEVHVTGTRTKDNYPADFSGMYFIKSKNLKEQALKKLSQLI